MRRKSNNFILISILAILIVGGCKKKKPTGTEEPSWKEMKSPTAKDLNSVFALSEDNAWAVGDSGVIIHWDGNKWSAVVSPTTKKLKGVYFVDANDGWTVGKDGTILHWNGSAWSEKTSPVGVDLNDVQFLSQNNGWIVGGSGTILHYDGKDWAINSQNGVDLTSLYFLSSTEGWVITKSYGGLFFYQNGELDMYEPHLTIAPYSIHFTDNSNGWMVGEECTDCSERRGSVCYYDSAKWHLEKFPESMKQNYWLSVFFVNKNEGWVAGADDEIAHVEGIENMLHYSEGEWSVINISGYKTVYSLYFIDAQSGWAVGEDGYILKFSE